MIPKSSVMQADFAGGCFWGVEEAFRKLPGVVKTAVGYEGGDTDNPTYEQVCAHTTGHTETLQVTYNPDTISYAQLLETFFAVHDPTQKNSQGANIGSNYRSAIFYHDKQQKKAAEQYIKKLQTKLKDPIVTELEPATVFWLAEDYHQQYYAKQLGKV